MEVLLKVWKALTGVFSWLKNTKITGTLLALALVILLSAAAGAWLASAPLSERKGVKSSGKSDASTVKITEPIAAAEAKVDTVSTVKFVTITKPGDPYPVYVDKEVLPDVWVESDTCVSLYGMCIQARFNPKLNAWKFKVWLTDVTIKTEVPVYRERLVEVPKLVNGMSSRLLFDARYNKFLEGHGVTAGLRYEVPVFSGFSFYSSADAEYRFYDKTFTPRFDAGILARIK